MSKDINMTILTGRLTDDPQQRTTSNGTSCCQFFIACNRTVKAENNDKTDNVDFFKCIAWKKTAEYAARNLKKGQRIHGVGRLQIDVYTNAKGVRNRNAEIVVEDIMIFQWPKPQSDSLPAHEDESRLSKPICN